MLFSCSLLLPKDRTRWTNICTGVVCLVKDGISKSYYIRVLDLKVSNINTDFYFRNFSATSFTKMNKSLNRLRSSPPLPVLNCKTTYGNLIRHGFFQFHSFLVNFADQFCYHYYFNYLLFVMHQGSVSRKSR